MLPFRECVIEECADNHSGPDLKTGAEILLTIWGRYRAQMLPFPLSQREHQQQLQPCAKSTHSRNVPGSLCHPGLHGVFLEMSLDQCGKWYKSPWEGPAGSDRSKCAGVMSGYQVHVQPEQGGGTQPRRHHPTSAWDLVTNIAWFLSLRSKDGSLFGGVGQTDTYADK